MTHDDYVAELMRRGCCDVRIAKRLAAHLAREQGFIWPELRCDVGRESKIPEFDDVTQIEARGIWPHSPPSAKYRVDDYRSHSAAEMCVEGASAGPAPRGRGVIRGMTAPEQGHFIGWRVRS